MQSTPVTKKSRVASICMKRVFNLGNYENIQYEISVEVGEKDDPGKILTSLELILEDVQAKSGVETYQLCNYREMLAKPKKELTQHEKERLPYYREQIKKHEEAMKRREKARAALATLNYTSTRKDAKLGWESEEDY
jgi:hypothetical protein